MKTVAMIPVRMGSKRIPKKNLRMLNDKPLVAHIIEAAKAADCFDAIYLNSEDEIFREIAQDYGIEFYKRPPELATDEATNDDFAYDFMKNVECETVIQLLATSPFITSEIINRFVSDMLGQDYDTLVSVKRMQIECVMKQSGNYFQPLNFESNHKTLPSQQLEPVMAYACGLMGWKTKIYCNNYDIKFGAYHGSYGNTKYHELSGLSTMDIDNEEDFLLAEKIMEGLAALKDKKQPEPQYYQKSAAVKRITGIEADVPTILAKDGVVDNDLFDVNHEIANIEKIIAEQIEKNSAWVHAGRIINAGEYIPVTAEFKMINSWSKRLVDTESNSATLIGQNPGEGNRLHYHHNWNEWWYIIRGEWDFEVEGKVYRVKKGDLVVIEKNKVHKITAAGFEPAIRLAVSRADVEHVYVNDKTNTNDGKNKQPESKFKSVNEQYRIWSKQVINSHVLNHFAGALEWGSPHDEKAVNKRGDVLGNYLKVNIDYVQPNIQNAVVVDLGSHAGKWIPQMDKAKHLICVDIFPEGFENIKELKSAGILTCPQIDFYLTSGNELAGIPDNSVDFIFSMDSLVRSEREIIQAYLKEFKRVLKPTGKTCVHFPSQDQPLSHELGFTQIGRPDIHEMAQEAGFDNYRLDYETINHGILFLANQ